MHVMERRLEELSDRSSASIDISVHATRRNLCSRLGNMNSKTTLILILQPAPGYLSAANPLTILAIPRLHQ
jgi:hypothetical protein